MSRSDPGMRLPSWLIAASLVVVVVATLTYFVTTSNDNTDEAAPSSETTSPSEAADSDKSSQSPEPKTDEKSDSKKNDAGQSKKQKNPADKPDPKNKPKPNKKHNSEKTKKAPQAPQTPEPSPDATVDVYNNAGITDLAASVSGDVRAAGFSVGGVDNWYGAIPSTTVYYPPGMEDQAELLADSLGVSRLMPAVDPMSGERLSLILTAAI